MAAVCGTDRPTTSISDRTITRRRRCVSSYRAWFFAVVVRLHSVPWSLYPVDVVQAVVPAAPHPTAQIDQPLGPVHQGCQQIRREHVDREQMGVAIHRRDPSRFAVAVAGVVDHRVEPAQPVRLLRDRSRLVGPAEVTDKNIVDFRKRANRCPTMQFQFRVAAT
jgi:hypothetical protein